MPLIPYYYTPAKLFSISQHPIYYGFYLYRSRLDILQRRKGVYLTDALVIIATVLAIVGRIIPSPGLTVHGTVHSL
jgi:hypothetical protein